MAGDRRTLLITGASSGIGKATAKLFAARGWNVAATMRRPEDADDLSSDPNILVARLDVEDRASIEEAIAATLARFGSIDALVNNAGYGQYGLFEALPREAILRQFNVNLFGVMDVTRALLPHMRARRCGVIINIGSGAGIFTLPMATMYCASKFALEGFSESLSYELASQNIAVKMVVPFSGVTATRFAETTRDRKASDSALSDYDAFIQQTGESFARLRTGLAISADDVARVIFEAATDGSDRLRYLIGDDFNGFVRARREMAEEDYIAFMRKRFSEGNQAPLSRGA
ncbi:SDR family oxidoreductase [Terrarubrum flagellatum]|uniref:SDR family oxidoreductase n=1 Tax=Terrirubrum flagellatum TaxID=2895980 RepID=UPI003144F562